MAEEEYTSSILPKNDIKRIQQIVDSLLFYARAVDTTIPPALNQIASNQAKPIINTKIAANMFIYYIHTHPNTKLRLLI